MADEGDSKSLVLITRVGSTPTTGIEKRVRKQRFLARLVLLGGKLLRRAFGYVKRTSLKSAFRQRKAVLSKGKKLVQHKNSIFVICDSTLLHKR